MTTAAVIGIGDISVNHLRAIDAMDDVHLVGVCDVVEERAQQAAARWHTEAFTDHQAMISALRPDVVHIALPHFLHVPVALDALRAGVNVLTEKPLAHTYATGVELADYARTAEPMLGVSFQNRYNPTSVALKKALDQGTYGKVLGARAAVWWSRKPAYYAASPWRGTWAQGGGGSMINQSIHTIDLLCWLLGAPEGIRGVASNLSLQGVIEVEDTSTTMIEHPGGVRSVILTTNAYVDNAPVELEIVTDQGTLAMHDGLLDFVAANGAITELATDTPAGGERSYWGSSHTLLIADYYATLATGKNRFWIDADAALVSLDVLRTVYVQSGLVPEGEK